MNNLSLKEQLERAEKIIADLSIKLAGNLGAALQSQQFGRDYVHREKVEGLEAVIRRINGLLHLVLGTSAHLLPPQVNDWLKQALELAPDGYIDEMAQKLAQAANKIAELEQQLQQRISDAQYGIVAINQLKSDKEELMRQISVLKEKLAVSKSQPDVVPGTLDLTVLEQFQNELVYQKKHRGLALIMQNFVSAAGGDKK